MFVLRQCEKTSEEEESSDYKLPKLQKLIAKTWPSRDEVSDMYHYWSESEAESFKAVPSRLEASQKWGKILYAEVIKKILEDSGHVKEFIAPTLGSLEETMKLAWTLSMSRQHDGSNAKGKEPYGHIWPLKDLVQGFPSGHPSINVDVGMFHHKNNPVLQQGWSVLFAIRKIKKGETLFVDYGAVDSATLLLSYGFLDYGTNWDNPYGEVVIEMGKHLFPPTSDTKRWKAIRCNGYNGPGPDDIKQPEEFIGERM
eukprot:m.25985 g.25985  ORF g.25985 m.25985 type:complete len:255 (-) comp7756_c0_seq1:809-1573(-)